MSGSSSVPWSRSSPPSATSWPAASTILILMRLLLGVARPSSSSRGSRRQRTSHLGTGGAARRSAWSPCPCTSGSRSGRSRRVDLHGWGYAAVWVVTAAPYVILRGPERGRPRDASARRGSEGRRLAPRNARSSTLAAIEPGLLALCGVWDGPLLRVPPAPGRRSRPRIVGALLRRLRDRGGGAPVLGARLPGPDRRGEAVGDGIRRHGDRAPWSGRRRSPGSCRSRRAWTWDDLFGAGVAFTLPAILAMAVIGIPDPMSGAWSSGPRACSSMRLWALAGGPRRRRDPHRLPGDVPPLGGHRGGRRCVPARPEARRGRTAPRAGAPAC